MRATTIALLIAATTATPAFARSPRSDDAEMARVTRTLNDPRTQDAMAGVMVAMADGLLDLRIDKLRAAMARLDPESARDDGYDNPRTLRDVVRRDDPNFEQNLYRDSRRATAQMGAMASGMADMLPELRTMGERMSKQLEKAMKRFPIERY